ncbi:MAG: TasA family protein [Acidimicrobiia bacterium]
MQAAHTQLSSQAEREKAQRRRVIPPLLRFGAIAGALVLMSALVVTGSRGAFSDTTDNAGNNWAAGTVTITDDDTGSAMFNASNMKPGDSVTNCIVATYSGTLVPADVRLYGVSGGTGLDAYLDVTIDEGSGGVFGNCTGFVLSTTPFSGTLATFAATHTNFTNGIAAWSPAANPESKTYRFTVTLQDNNLAQGLNGTATFTWEAQNQ